MTYMQLVLVGLVLQTAFASAISASNIGSGGAEGSGSGGAPSVNLIIDIATLIATEHA